ncbi:MAG: hypothetical protein N2578_05040 [Bdellovibrionaceae bacterium]|nr:hypothetical protein [Pseudobdellovibrionaceae bacterium]
MTSHPKPRRQRYREVQGKKLIEVKVRSSTQLFDARDPAPFRERDLDDDFAEYIITSAEEFSTGTPLKLSILIGESEKNGISRDVIREAIRSHFIYQSELKRLQLKKLFKTAQLFLFVGLITLATCLGTAGLLPTQGSAALTILREGIVIVGWVSMWRPFELILFDWYPLYDKLRFLRKLIEIEIEVNFEEGA